MIKLQTGGTSARLAEAAQTGAYQQLIFLGGGKMRKTQGDCAGAVLQPTYYTAAASVNAIAGANLALDHRAGIGLQRGQRGHPGSVQIAGRQMKQYILNGMQSEFVQFSRELRADPLKSRHR